MLLFSNVYITRRVRASLQKVVRTAQHRKFWELVLKLKEGRFNIPGLNVEKLHGKSSNLFSARMNKEMRLIFSTRTESNSKGLSLVIHELNHHDEAYESITRRKLEETNLEAADQFIANLSKDSEQANLTEHHDLSDHDLTDDNEASRQLELDLQSCAESESVALHLQLFRVPEALLSSNPEKCILFEKSLDRYLTLSEEQEEILALREKAFLVQGPAGTGKTTLALFSALNFYEEHENDAVYLFTYHEELACVCRAYKVNLIGESEEEERPLKVFSYLDFCKSHLREALKTKGKQRSWISAEQSIKLLRQIISSKPRWARALRAEDLWGLIYSILKGRFMPGTERLPANKEDYEHIFKDYGKTPEFFDDTLEVFALYQNRLELNSLIDEADVIRLSYNLLKQNTLLAAEGKRLWIVIDEIQDFSELEWKSILLFWENHCKQFKGDPSFPFLSGDTNQNISRSGFRWQELESYLQTILRKMHRPNSLRKVTLHRNYRNTLQIHRLATFIRGLASDAGDLGLPPEHEGDRPCLVVASDQQLLTFLKEKESEKQSSNPLVVLVEDDDSLNFLRKELGASQSVFLFSLRSSKGMEFEDVIIYRAFSSAAQITEQAGGLENRRMFDLWYMGISRARNNLLLVQNKEDSSKLREVLKTNQAVFSNLVETQEPEKGFEQFWQKRDLEMPNYNVIFLERKLAQDLWDEYLKTAQSSATDNDSISDYGKSCCQRALTLWRRCLDYSSLGRALKHLKKFEEAAVFLKRAWLNHEAAICLEAAGNYIDAAHEFESLGLVNDAARCFEQGQDHLKAAQLLADDGIWNAAAQNYQSAGDLANAALCYEKAEQFESAAQIYKRQGLYKKSALMFEKCDSPLEAAEMYLLIKDKLEAARCFQKAQSWSQAFPLFEEEQKWDAAASCAEQMGLQKEAAELFLQAGNLDEAARNFAAAGSPQIAAELYFQINDYQQAAQNFEQAERFTQAAEMYELAQNWQKAIDLAQGKNEMLEARCLEKLGDFAAAAKLFEKNGAINEAAVCLEKTNEFEAAADLHLKIENWSQAANCLAKIDRRIDAAKLYVVSGQIPAAYELVISQTLKVKSEDLFSSLLNWCVESQKTAAAAQLLELKKDYLQAAEKYRECLMFSRAAECLEKFGRPRDAAILFRQSGNIERAADCFRIARQWQDAGKCFEQARMWAEAKNMYKRCGDSAAIARCNNAMNWF